MVLPARERGAVFIGTSASKQNNHTGWLGTRIAAKREQVSHFDAQTINRKELKRAIWKQPLAEATSRLLLDEEYQYKRHCKGHTVDN
jgi:hypothetical protein